MNSITKISVVKHGYIKFPGKAVLMRTIVFTSLAGTKRSTEHKRTRIGCSQFSIHTFHPLFIIPVAQHPHVISAVQAAQLSE